MNDLITYYAVSTFCAVMIIRTVFDCLRPLDDAPAHYSLIMWAIEAAAVASVCTFFFYLFQLR